LRNLAILNGNIEGGVTNNAGTYDGPGFGYGITYSGFTAPRNVRVIGINVFGCRYYGINVGDGDSTVVESCAVRTVGNVGIVASVVKNCTALDCGTRAISGSTVSDCRGESTGSGYGVRAFTALNCYGYNRVYGDYGVYAYKTAQNCYGESRNGNGVYAATAQNCHGYNSGSGGYGVYANNAQNCYGYHSGYLGAGVYATQTAIGCVGVSSYGLALVAQNAAFCVGERPDGTAIQATLANGCWAAAGTNLITYKYSMP
jgi:hypothetical protein